MQKNITERERIIRTLKGEQTDRMPWATRLDIWHTASVRSSTLEEKFIGVDLNDIHVQLGVGRQAYAIVYRQILKGVDITVEFNGEVVKRDSNPTTLFPIPYELVHPTEPGITKVHFKTPVGTAYLAFKTTAKTIREFEIPYLVEHIIKDDEDFEIVKWILNHSETIISTDLYYASEERVGDNGFTIPMMGRSPFQQIMIEYLGEEETIFTMYDHKSKFDYLLAAISDHLRRALELCLELPSPMVEFVDNFEGSITSPKLFSEYCMPFLQECADKAHSKGKLLGSHMDGNMKPLVDLIPESGIDVVESFSPYPLTAITFQEAWAKWQGKVLMWGVIPSIIFEPQTSEADFEDWLESLFDTLDGDKRIIFGIGDQAIGPTITDRIRRVSDILISKFP